jgi:outer membrane protein assembly factor BamD
MKQLVKLLFLFVLVIFASCGQYEKVLKSQDYTLKYQKAMEYYNKADYTRAATLFDQIVNVYKATSKADTVSYYQAMSYYGQEDYVMAGFYFSEMVKDYPRSPFAMETEYLSAYCNYLQSPRPSLDQEYTKQAIQGFTLFLSHYPTSKYVADAKKLIEELQNKLVEKSFNSAKMYYEMGYYKASIIALRNSLNEFPDTKYREEIMFLIFKSNFLYADNSIYEKQRERFQVALDEYYSYVGEYPTGIYQDEVEKMHTKIVKTLGSQDSSQK